MIKKRFLLFSILICILLFCLNALLFFPAYFVESQFFSIVTEGSNKQSLWELLVQGNTNDFFQISGEFLCLLIPFFFLKKEHWLTKFYKVILVASYLFLLYYHIYYQGYKAAYSVHPIFANDWVILKEILPTFLREVSVTGGTYLKGTLSFLGLSLIIGTALIFCANQLISLRKSPVLWSVIGLFLLGGYWNYPKNTEINDQMRLSDTTELSKENAIDTSAAAVLDSLGHPLFQPIVWTYPDIQNSATLNRADHLAHLKKRWIYDFYKSKKLVQKPNVYLLFIESYGGVATLSDYCEAPYKKLANQLYTQLDSAGWAVSSNYSKSTVIGGRSWLAMTTAMIGARVEDQIQYSELINTRQTFPHMVDWFNLQGYQTTRMSTMRITHIDTLNMVTIPNQFWKFDNRYFYPDVKYKGHDYDYYGGIPDQYSLNYADDNFLKDRTTPHFFTAITMNSHGPWQSKMPPIVADWKSLNNPKSSFNKEKTQADMSIFNYWISIEYQLKMITDFILKKGRENSIYIILGDHNPGGLEFKLFKKFDKWATPIHIISKEVEFVQSFENYGFTKGMEVDTAQFEMMRHMGLYSLLTRQLLDNYGEEEVVLPEYLPWGLRTEPEDWETRKH